MAQNADSRWDGTKWVPPLDFAGPIRGGTAGINSAEFYICPSCHACVMESRSDDFHRTQHLSWHAREERPA